MVGSWVDGSSMHLLILPLQDPDDRGQLVKWFAAGGRGSCRYPLTGSSSLGISCWQRWNSWSWELIFSATISWQWMSLPTKVGAILKKSVDWSNTDVILPYYIYLYRFKSQKFWTMKRYKYFYAINLNRQSDSIISTPRILKGEAIQVLLCQKFWIVKATVSFQTPEF